MSERRRKRGRPRSTPMLSYASELKMRNSITRVIKKPRYLTEIDEEESNHSARSMSPSAAEDKVNKAKNKRGYNPDIDDRESEYLYGSDFELEELEEESDYKSGSGDETRDGDEVEEEFLTDGEASVSSYGTTHSGAPGTPLSFQPPSRPPTPIPVWLQDRPYPALDLPKSSDDLLLPCSYVLRAVGIYEVLRHFRTLVRLSPTRFEDFCAALVAEEQSSLLAEIHMALLKALIREEDSQQTHFGPLDQKDSINVILYFIDSLTWPESLRLYLQSDSEFWRPLKILNTCNYPFTSLENRLQVLQFLCDQFLQTSVVREDLLSEGKVRYDDHCRVCHKTGDLLCCDSCSAVYHLDCVDPPLQDVPGEMEDWTCSVCTIHQVDGVTDCISPMETSGVLCRQDPLGFDRHGRKYWFLVRRLFIESEAGEVWYYSTQAQLEELKELLDPHDLEDDLCGGLSEVWGEVRRHMAITETITNASKGVRKSYLEVEDAEVAKRIEERKRMKQKKAEGIDSLIEEIKEEDIKKEVKQEATDDLTSTLDPVTGELHKTPTTSMDIEVKEEVKEVKEEKEEEDKKETGVKTRTKTGSLVPKQFAVDDLRRRIPPPSDLDCKDGVKNVLGGAEGAKLVQLQNSSQHYRLGCDGKYKVYMNQYSSNALALNKLQHNEERDKRRHLSHKFSLTPNAEFKWNGVMHGNTESLISTLRHTVLSLEQNISTHLYHPHWASIRKGWNSSVLAATDPHHFSRVLMWLVACIKPVVFNPVWHDSLGHVRFNRVTAMEREEKKKQEKRDKKEENQEEPRPVTMIKYTLGLKHQVWKLKGEEYRVHGMWGWQWVSAHRPAPHTPMNTVGLRGGASKHMVPVKSAAGLKSLSVNPGIYKQLAAKNPFLRPCLLSPKQRAKKVEEEGLTEDRKEILITGPSGQQKVEVGCVNLEELFEPDGRINVSHGLTHRSRFLYPKVARGCSLDGLLGRCVAQRTQDNKDNTPANKKGSSSSSSSGVGGAGDEEEEDEVDVENEDTDATLSDVSDKDTAIEELPASQRSTIHKQRPAGNLLKEVRQLKAKYEALDLQDSLLTCYSPCCRRDGRCRCYSSLCLLKVRTKEKLINAVNNYRIVASKPSPFHQVGSHSPVRLREATPEPEPPTLPPTTDSNGKGEAAGGDSDGRSSRASGDIKIRVDEDMDDTSQGSTGLEAKFAPRTERLGSTESPAGRFQLKKAGGGDGRRKRPAHRLPQLSVFRVGRRKTGKADRGDERASSILVVPGWELRLLARKGGRHLVQGFNHNAKANQVVWPYPCPRPVFKTTWLYRTATAASLNTASMQLRILWVCLRWDDMQEKGPGDGRKQITTDMEIIQTEILKRKHSGRFLEKTSYLRRKVIIPFDVPKPVREFTPSQRSGLRKRRRAQSPVNTQPQSVEEWVEEDKLDLWEIRFFGERLERAAVVTRRGGGDRGEAVQTVTTTTGGAATPAEIRARMEEQLKIQRANFNQKRAAEGGGGGGGGGGGSVALTRGGVVKLSLCSAATITTGGTTRLALPQVAAPKVVHTGASTIMAVGGQLPTLVGGKKIVTAREGRIITVQTAAAATPGTTGGEGGGASTINLGSSTIFPVGGGGAAKVQVTSAGNKVIRLQPLAGGSGHRVILPRAAATPAAPTLKSPRPVAPAPSSATTTTAATTTTTTAAVVTGGAGAGTGTGPRPTGQQIHIIRLMDGQLQVRGLLEGQHVVQKDGKFHFITKPSAATTAPAIQVTQQTKPCPSPGGGETAPKATVASTAHVLKVNGQQVLLRHNSEGAKTGVALTASEANTVVARPAGGVTSPRIKTILAPDGTMVKTVLANSGANTTNTTNTTTTTTTTPVITTPTTTTTTTTTTPSDTTSTTTTTPATTTTTTTTIVAAAASTTSTTTTTTTTTTSSSSSSSSSGGSSLTLRVQVRMTEQGPKTIIQGLQMGVALTKDHIMAIQQQVRNMLAQYKLQVNQLSPVMTLTLHMPNKQAAAAAAANTLPTQQQQQQQEETAGTNAPTLQNQQNTPTEAGGVSEGDKGANSTKTPGATTTNTSPKKFVLTPEYIQQTIKSALSREDLAPEIEEKLMQFQKYNSEQTKKEEGGGLSAATAATQATPASALTAGTTTATRSGGPATRKAASTVNSLAAPRNSGVKRTRDQDDADWDPSEEGAAMITPPATTTPATPPTSKSRSKKQRSDSSRPSEPSSKSRRSSAKGEAMDAKKRQALQHKLDSLMTRHKDLLKKDILKKRAQLEKELQVEIHKELSVAKLQLQLHERTKAETTHSGTPSQRKKKSASESSGVVLQSTGVDIGGHLVHTPSPPVLEPPQGKHHSKTSSSSSSSKHHVSSSSSSTSSKSSSASKKSAKNKNKKIVCICRTPFDDTKFYVGCDLCGNWFHGDCVGITEAMSRSMTEYVCDDCANAKLNRELFCFCRQPYDETQFYICCEQCEDWYHGKCVGIMQTEADDIDDYICPKCDTNNVWNYPCQKTLTAKDYTDLRKVTKSLIQHKNAWPFLEPVDPSEVPDYYKVVKEPMDLKTVENRVDEKWYQRLAQFVGDVMLVFDNCRLYNPPNSSFCSCAATLEGFFCQKLRSLKLRLGPKP